MVDIYRGQFLRIFMREVTWDHEIENEDGFGIGVGLLLMSRSHRVTKSKTKLSFVLAWDYC